MSETVPHPELSRPAESVFPLDIEALERRLKVFEASSETMLRFVTDVRGRWGPATDLYTNMPFGDLTEWHVSEKDFEKSEEIYYRTGLLYGMDLAEEAYARRFPEAKPLVAANLAAFDSALAYMRETYRDLDDNGAYPTWRRQKDRELHYTGSDLLTLAAATQQDLLHRRLPTNGDADSGTLALHVGMVDGAIFVDAYRTFDGGGQPEVAEDPVAYAPVLNKRHIRGSILDGAMLIQFEGANELASTVREIQSGAFEVPTHYDLVGPVAYAERQIIQMGPNHFTTMSEIKKMGLRRHSRAVLGGVAMFGYSLGDVGLAQILDSPLPYLPLSAAAGVASFKLHDHVMKRQAIASARHYEVPFDPSFPASLVEPRSTVQKLRDMRDEIKAAMNMGDS